jgi:anti-sigma regulatory factor (Ser/Thr protein kinase)
VEGVATAVRDAALAKGLSLHVELPPTPTFVVADGSRIDQVLTNLVVNSVRYTHAGDVRVTLHPYDEATKHLHFTVADTGPGIPPAMLPALLEPHKLESSTVRKGLGSGIGLAVVRTLVDHLGGTISVSSEESVGTSFEVRIPAELIDSNEPSDERAPEERRVLIIDDREDVLTGLTSVINELGYECDRASTIAVATNLLAARRYDAVLFDIQMPGKSGAGARSRDTRGQGTEPGNALARHERRRGDCAVQGWSVRRLPEQADRPQFPRQRPANVVARDLAVRHRVSPAAPPDRTATRIDAPPIQPHTRVSANPHAPSSPRR